MGGRSGGNVEIGQVQQEQPVSALRHRRVFEIRVGGTPQGQDGYGRDPSLRKGAETSPGTNPPQASNGRRQRILQQDLPRPDDVLGHSPRFHGRGHQSQRGGTFQSHLEATPLSVFHRREHAVVCVRPARDRAGVQSIPSLKHRDGPSRRRRRQRRSRVAEAVRQERETEATHLQSGRPRAIEKEASHLQEELSAGLDRGSVHGDAGEARSRTHVQDRRVGRHPRPSDLLRERFAKG